MNEQIISKLKDIHYPSAIHFWLLSPGWVFLYIIFILVFIFFIKMMREKRKKIQTKKNIIFEWENIISLVKNKGCRPIVIDIFLRKLITKYCKRNDFHHLSEQQWIQYLNGLVSNEKNIINMETALYLTDTIYRETANEPDENVITNIEFWLRQVIK